MTQSLFELDNEFSTSLNSNYFGFLFIYYHCLFLPAMRQEVLRALCGASLDTEEFFKIDKTGE